MDLDEPALNPSVLLNLNPDAPSLESNTPPLNTSVANASDLKSPKKNPTTSAASPNATNSLYVSSTVNVKASTTSVNPSTMSVNTSTMSINTLTMSSTIAISKVSPTSPKTLTISPTASASTDNSKGWNLSPPTTAASINCSEGWNICPMITTASTISSEVWNMSVPTTAASTICSEAWNISAPTTTALTISLSQPTTAASTISSQAWNRSPLAMTFKASSISPPTSSPISPNSSPTSISRSTELPPDTSSSSGRGSGSSSLESPDSGQPHRGRRRNTTSPKRDKSGTKSDVTPKRGASSPSIKTIIGNIFRRGSVSQKPEKSPRNSPGSKSPKKSEKQTSTPSQGKARVSIFFGLAYKPDASKGHVVPKRRPFLSSDCKNVELSIDSTSLVDQISPIKNVGEYFVDSDSFSTSGDSRIDYAVLDDDKIIPTFLNSRLCYNAMPKSGKVIALTTDLLIKNAFSSLLINEIKSAPLWDSETQSFVGILTITDFINVLRHYHYNSKEDIQAIENQQIQTWRRLTNVTKPLVKIGPCDSLATAAKMLIYEGVHRLPVIDEKRCSVLFIMTNRRLLQYLHQNLLSKFESSTVKTPSFMKKTIGELKIGTYENIATITPETTVIEVLDIFVERNISSLPVVENSTLTDIFAKFDVFALAKEQTYHNLNISISEALKKTGVHEELYTCTLDESLEVVISRFVTEKVHRIVVIDQIYSVIGIISLSDILKYLVIQSLDLSCFYYAVVESGVEANETIEEEAASTSSTGQESKVASGSELETEQLQSTSEFSKPESPDLSEDFLKLQVVADPSETLPSASAVDPSEEP